MASGTPIRNRSNERSLSLWADPLSSRLHMKEGLMRGTAAGDRGTSGKSARWLLAPAVAGLAWLGASCGGEPEDPSASAAAAVTAGATTYEAEVLARKASATGSQVTSEAGASAGRYVQLSGTPATGA